MASGNSHSCSHYHSMDTGFPNGVGIHRIETESQEIVKNILDKLKIDDKGMQEQFKKWNGYAFNMGNGSLFTDYKEAQDALLERNFPDIYQDQQKGAI